MRVAVRKLPIEDIATLQALVVENFDAIEPGLTVLDSRLLLGHATIDVIGVDAAGALVLGAIGTSANEEMLLKAVEAYSWCLEYPESLTRHYPGCVLSEDRPPRLLFVVERVPDAFHRKIKQLGFPEVDCVEVRHLEFDGVGAVYFETLLRLRRAGRPSRVMVDTDASDAETADPASPRMAVPRPARLAPASVPDAPVAAPRVQRAVPAREHAPVVNMAARQGAPGPRAEATRPAIEPTVPLVPEALAPEIAPTTLEPTVVLPTLAASPATVAPVAAAGAVATGLPELSLGSVVVEDAPAPAARPAEPGVSFEELAASLLSSAASQPATAVAPREPVVQLPAAPAMPEPSLPADLGPALTVEALVAGATASASSPAPRPAPAPEPARPALGALPQEFEGLKFPNDGVLTRQWMEFLSQMSGNNK